MWFFFPGLSIHLISSYFSLVCHCFDRLHCLVELVLTMQQNVVHRSFRSRHVPSHTNHKKGFSWDMKWNWTNKITARWTTDWCAWGILMGVTNRQGDTSLYFFSSFKGGNLCAQWLERFEKSIDNLTVHIKMRPILIGMTYLNAH